MDIALGFLAGMLHVLAFGIYNKKMFEGRSQPNTATWSLWAVLTALNMASYYVASGDWVMSLLPSLSSVACILTFCFAVWKRKLKGIDVWDCMALVIGLISALVWWLYQSAAYASLVMQAAIFVSFIPTYRDVWKDAKKETPLPWCIWSIAYVVGIVVVMIRWKGRVIDLVYPVNCLFLHAGIASISAESIRVRAHAWFNRLGVFVSGIPR